MSTTADASARQPTPATIAKERLPTLYALLERGIAGGAETGSQAHVRHGSDEYDVALGDDGSGRPFTPATLVPWTCTSKPVGGLAFAGAWDDGQLSLDEPVQSYLPEYHSNGKDAVRLRHVLTHTTGVRDTGVIHTIIRSAGTPWEDVEPAVWQAVLDAPVTSPPGSAMVYNVVANWFVLDRVIAAVRGWKPGESYPRVLAACHSHNSRLGSLAIGRDEDRVRIHSATQGPEQRNISRMNALLSFPLPGVSVWGPCADLARVGSVLMHDGRAPDARLASPAATAALTTAHWCGSAQRTLTNGTYKYGLGVMTEPALLCGDACTRWAYGHSGGNTSMFVVDPPHDLVFAVYWNGRLPDVECAVRRHATARAVYTDLSLLPT